MNIRKFIIGTTTGALMLGAMVVPAYAASSYMEDFESFPSGIVNGHDGWSMTGSYDVGVVSNIYGYSSFGNMSLRMSDAITSSSFGDQTFAKPLADSAGEADSTYSAFAVGTMQSHFETQFDIASVMKNAQPGMHVSVSPDRGDGSRMSYLRFEDGANGINVFFDDVQQSGACSPAGCANFVETQIGTNLTRIKPHTIKLTMDFVNGPGNDVVKVYIDGALVHTGTSWEDYYRYDPEASAEQTPRIVKTVLFRESGTANGADAGKGFLVDNLSLSSGSVMVAPPTNMNQCNNNGWKTFTTPVFKNQGACVSYVQSNVHAGKRPE